MCYHDLRRYIFSSAPVSGNNAIAQSALLYFANKLVAEGEVVLRPEDFAVPDATEIKSAKQLSLVEEMYSIVDTYRWLAVRFPDELPSGTLTVKLADRMAQLITDALDAPWFSADDMRAARGFRQQKAERRAKKAARKNAKKDGRGRGRGGGSGGGGGGKTGYAYESYTFRKGSGGGSGGIPSRAHKEWDDDDELRGGSNRPKKGGGKMTKGEKRRRRHEMRQLRKKMEW